MAYDLFFRKQIPQDVSRGGRGPAHAAEGLGVLAAIVFCAIPQVRRRAEDSRYRRELSTAYEGCPLRRTQEVPAVPMAEIVRHPWNWE